MLVRFEPHTFDFDPKGEYYAATIDENGTQALVWAAMSRAFVVAACKLPEGPEAGVLANIGADRDNQQHITESAEGWELIASLLGEFGREAGMRRTDYMPGGSPDRLDQELHQIGAWAIGLSLEIRMGKRAYQRSKPDLYHDDSGMA